MGCLHVLQARGCALHVRLRRKGIRGRGREGSPVLAQAGTVPGTRGLMLGSPSVLCSHPALGSPDPAHGSMQDHCSASLVTFPSPGSPLHLWLGGCQVLPWEKPCQKPPDHEMPPPQHTGTSLCPLATLLHVISGFPVGLWCACSLHLPPSTGWHGDFQCPPLHVPHCCMTWMGTARAACTDKPRATWSAPMVE